MFTSILRALIVKQDVIILTENWIDDDDDEGLYDLEGYNAFHCARQGRSGGVSVYFSNNNLVANRIEELSVSNIIVESSVVEIVVGTDTFVIFAVYRPHSGTKLTRA